MNREASELSWQESQLEALPVLFGQRETALGIISWGADSKKSLPWSFYLGSAPAATILYPPPEHLPARDTSEKGQKAPKTSKKGPRRLQTFPD